MRPGSQVCRYGGEEFCLLLPQVDVADAVALAEQIRATIEGSRCAGLELTASFGVSAWGLGAGDPRELLDQADKSLYFSKRRAQPCHRLASCAG